MSSDEKEQKIRDRGWEIEMKKYESAKSMLSSFYKSWFAINIGAIGLVLTYLISFLSPDKFLLTENLVIWLVFGIFMFLTAALSIIYLMYFEATTGETSTLMQYLHLNELDRYNVMTQRITNIQNKFSELSKSSNIYLYVVQATSIFGFAIGLACVTMGILDSLISTAWYIPCIIIVSGIGLGLILVRLMNKLQKWSNIELIYNEINQNLNKVNK